MHKPLSVLVGFLCVMLVPLTAVAAESKMEMEPVVIHSSDMKYVALSPDVRRAVIWGNPDGAYQALTRIAKGAKAPMRTPPHDLRIVVLSGYLGFHAGSGEKRIVFATYVMVPAGLPFTADCDTSSTCFWVEQSSGKMP
ncbi:MAG: hypothetical protein AABO58_06105 [Acidobacteriota bacterium]